MSDTPSNAPPIDRRAFVARALGAGIGLASLASSSRPARGTPRPAPALQDPRPLRVLLWCEGTAPRAIYPDDIDGALDEHLRRQEGLAVRRARLDDEGFGVDDATLDATDVVVWWGRLRHDDLPAERGEAVARRVREGALGLVALHASCRSRPFRALMGMACEPGGWREDGLPERVHIQSPDHPIARGVSPFTIARSDMFAEPLQFPEPESVVLVSSWDTGESARSGLTWTVGKGRVAYLRAGLDAFPVLYHPSMRQLVWNAVTWAGGRA